MFVVLSTTINGAGHDHISISLSELQRCLYSTRRDNQYQKPGMRYKSVPPMARRFVFSLPLLCFTCCRPACPVIHDEVPHTHCAGRGLTGRRVVCLLHSSDKSCNATGGASTHPMWATFTCVPGRHLSEMSNVVIH